MQPKSFISILSTALILELFATSSHAQLQSIVDAKRSYLNIKNLVCNTLLTGPDFSKFKFLTVRPEPKHLELARNLGFKNKNAAIQKIEEKVKDFFAHGEIYELADDVQRIFKANGQSDLLESIYKNLASTSFNSLNEAVSVLGIKEVDDIYVESTIQFQRASHSLKMTHEAYHLFDETQKYSGGLPMNLKLFELGALENGTGFVIKYEDIPKSFNNGRIQKFFVFSTEAEALGFLKKSRDALVLHYSALHVQDRAARIFHRISKTMNFDELVAAWPQYQLEHGRNIDSVFALDDLLFIPGSSPNTLKVVGTTFKDDVTAEKVIRSRCSRDDIRILSITYQSHRRNANRSGSVSAPLKFTATITLPDLKDP